MDSLSKKRRSWNMSRIRAKDTQPELVVRSILHKMGFRFRVHVRTLPGCPDIVLRRWRTVVLVHGCFWHRHRGCALAYTPKTRPRFWLAKFEGNVQRDRDVQRVLRGGGWKVVVVWECEISDTERLAKRLRDAVSS
jgi:DNA mismatch endonuclease, patch repair protein